MRKHVELIEPSPSGHHLALYVRYVLPGLMEAGYDVSLLTTMEAASHPAMDLVKAAAPRPFPIRLLPSLRRPASTSTCSLLVSQLTSWWSIYRHYLKIAADHRPDIIYLPTADWVVKAIEILGSPFGETPFALLYMSPKHHRHAVGIGSKSRNDRLYDFLFRRLLRLPRLQSVLVIDELFYEFAQKQYRNNACKITFVPDFGKVNGALSKQECRRKLGIPVGAKVLLVYGSLSTRKGILPLLEAIAELGNANRVVVLLAGVPSYEIGRTLESEPYLSLIKNQKVLTRFYFHDTAQEYEVFRASDMVWLGYTEGFSGSSGVLHQAISLCLPLVAMESGFVGYLVSKHELGLTFKPENKVHLQNLILKISSRSWSWEADSAKAFRSAHTAQMHVAKVLNILRQTQG
jgi:glycosyltransferase involved in cell wall biosynthesis